ncbi:hypothetical protein F5146DRAFT_1068543 [Armillaria mellea]|nr:hypothetical protein F5146DRAFT_1068543 [Armillaria mellea]
MDIIRSSKLPPRCWYHLMINSADDFDPLDPDNDDHTNMFPLNLCTAILRSFDAPPRGLMQDFNSPLVLDFNDALPYFLDKICDTVLLVFSEFVGDQSLDEPSLPQSLRLFVVALKFVLHRLSLPQPDLSILWPLLAAVKGIGGQTFSLQEATAVIMVLEDLLVHCVIRPLNIEPDVESDVEPDWSELFQYAIQAYQSLAMATPSACSLRGIQSIVDFMTINWDQTTDVSYQSDAACGVLTNLLAKRIPVALTTFLESECLQFLGSHTLHAASISLVREYVAWIFAMQHRSHGAADEATLQLHIDYLHNPDNLFTACSILVTRRVNDHTERTSIYRDITTLVQLCPRDVAWGECRRKLHDLAQSSDEDFFSKQLVWSSLQRPLQTNEIQVEKDNINYAIRVLDVFFDGRAQTGMGRIIHFLGRYLGQKPADGRAEHEQQV